MKRYLPILLSLVFIFILENTFYLLNSKTESLLDIFVFSLTNLYLDLHLIFLPS